MGFSGITQREALHAAVMQTHLGATTANVVKYACGLRQRDGWFPIQRELASMKDCGMLVFNQRSSTWSLPVQKDDKKKKIHDA